MTELVVPGAIIYEVPKSFEGSYVEDGKTFASVLSVRYDDKVVPLKGKYSPITGDYVVGIVSRTSFNNYGIDLNSPYEGLLFTRDLREEFKVGDVVSAFIDKVDEVNEPVLGNPRKLWQGRLIEVDAVKIPRVIGRNSSMVSMIEEHTNAKLFVGKNGRIYVKEGNIALAVEAIFKIAREAHMHGLTDRMKAFLEEESKKATPA